MLEKIGIGWLIILGCSIGADFVFVFICEPIFKNFFNFTYRRITKIRIFITYPILFISAILDVCLFEDFIICILVLIEVWDGSFYSIQGHIREITQREPYGIFSFNHKIAKIEAKAFQSLDENEMEVYLEQYFKTCEKLPSRTRILLTQVAAWGIGSLIGLGVNLIL